MRLVKIPKFTNYLWVNFRVSSSFGLPQTVGFATALWLFEAWKPFCLVKVKVFVCNDPLQTEKILHASQFARRVAYQPFAVDEMNLGERKVGQPSLQVLGV